MRQVKIIFRGLESFGIWSTSKIEMKHIAR